MNSITSLPSQQQIFYDRAMLERLLPELVFLQHGQKYGRPIPKNEGATINFRRMRSLNVPANSLTEGVTPAGSNLTIDQITALVRQEGDFVTLSDWLDLVGIDPVIIEATEVLTEQAKRTLETRVRDIVFAGTNVFFVGGGAARNTVGRTHVVTGLVCRAVRQIMARNHVKPIGGDYIGFIHPDGAFSLKGDTEWLEAYKYVQPQNIWNGEIGKLHGIRWIETTMCPIWPGTGLPTPAPPADVYGALVVGDNAYGVVDIAGSAKPEIIVKQRGASGTADPLDQRSSVGWKAAMTAVRLQELAIMRIEHGSAL